MVLTTTHCSPPCPIPRASQGTTGHSGLASTTRLLPASQGNVGGVNGSVGSSVGSSVGGVGSVSGSGSSGSSVSGGRSSRSTRLSTCTLIAVCNGDGEVKFCEHASQVALELFVLGLEQDQLLGVAVEAVDATAEFALCAEEVLFESDGGDDGLLAVQLLRVGAWSVISALGEGLMGGGGKTYQKKRWLRRRSRLAGCGRLETC